MVILIKTYIKTFLHVFCICCSEVFKALNKTRGLYLRWIELQNGPAHVSTDEIEWTNTELKNSLRSIEWDLEDLEDTIDILLRIFFLTFSDMIV